MNHLFAKTKGKQEEYQNILADKEVYKRPSNLENTRIYTPTYYLEEDEWFVIEEFSKQEYCIELLKNPFQSTSYKTMSKPDPEQAEYICSYQDGNEYYFQRVFKHSLLNQKLIKFGDEIKLEQKGKSIVVNDEPDALYIKSEDRLYFKKLETIAPIFAGIDMLYREATKEETEEFLNSEFIAADGYDAEDVGKANRKRIALATATLKKFTKKERKAIFDYTHKYYPNIKFEKGKFSITSNEDLKFLLWGIGQRFYTTPVTEENRVANSVIDLPKK